MSPMTRTYSIEGVPGRDVAEYYRRRAEGGTGLIVTEGVAIDHETAVDHANVPNLHTPAAQAGWRKVVDDVHAAGGKIVPQLWHVGPLWGAMTQMDPSLKPMRPSGEWGPLGVTSYSAAYVERAQASTEAMTEQDIQDVIDAYVRSAKHAVELGFDGIAIHGGHGYLLDSFFWEGTNQRDDAWGGDLERRTRFPAAVVAAIRAAIGPDLPIIYRFSQHKQQDFTAKIAETPEEFGRHPGRAGRRRSRRSRRQHQAFRRAGLRRQRSLVGGLGEEADRRRHDGRRQRRYRKVAAGQPHRRRRTCSRQHPTARGAHRQRRVRSDRDRPSPSRRSCIGNYPARRWPATGVRSSGA